MVMSTLYQRSAWEMRHALVDRLPQASRKGRRKSGIMPVSPQLFVGQKAELTESLQSWIRVYGTENQNGSRRKLQREFSRRHLFFFI